MRAPPHLTDLLDLQKLGPAKQSILAGLDEETALGLALVIDRAVETAIHEAIDPAVPADEHQEFWWIFSDAKEEWAGIRMAVFRKDPSGNEFILIQGENAYRNGPRQWPWVADQEGWRKVMRIPVPNGETIEATRP